MLAVFRLLPKCNFFFFINLETVVQKSRCDGAKLSVER